MSAPILLDYTVSGFIRDEVHIRFTWYQYGMWNRNENVILVQQLERTLPLWLVLKRNLFSVPCKQIQGNIGGLGWTRSGRYRLIPVSCKRPLSQKFISRFRNKCFRLVLVRPYWKCFDWAIGRLLKNKGVYKFMCRCVFSFSCALLYLQTLK